MKAFLLVLSSVASLPGLSAVLTPRDAEVVVAPRAAASVRFAGGEMTNYLSRVLGAAVPLADRPTEGRASIVLGANAWSKAEGIDADGLETDAFVVKATANRVYIVGRDDARLDIGRILRAGGYGDLLGYDRATLHGVYDFLERVAGVRFYLPDDELGVIVPRSDRLSIPEGTRTVVPDNLIREPYMDGDGVWYNAKDGRENQRIKALQWLRLRMSSARIPCCHGSRDFKYIERFGKTHPEYLALKKDGSRWTDPKSHFAPYQYCWTNPGFREELYQDVKAYLTGQPASSRGLKGWGPNCRHGKWVDIMPDDSFQGCWCEGCQKAYTRHKDGRLEEQYAAEMIWGYAREIGERLIREGVKGSIVMMSYNPYDRVPDFKLPPNVQVMVAVGGPWSLVRHEALAKEHAHIRAWTEKLGQKVWLWTYPHKWGGTAIPNIPCHAPNAWGRYFQDLKGDIFGTFAECECDKSVFNHLNYYVFSRVMWQTETDIPDTIDEYHRLMFGAGAENMKAFNGILERKWTREITGRILDTKVGPIPKAPSIYELWHHVYSPETLGELRRNLHEAEGSTAPCSLERKRIALMKRTLYDPLVADANAYLEKTDVKLALKRRAARLNTSIVPDFDAKSAWGGAKFTLDTVNYVTPPHSLCFEGDGTAGVRVMLDARGDLPAMKPNTRYRLSYFVKTEGVEPLPLNGGGGGVSVNVWDDRNHWFPSSASNPRGASFTGTMDWIYQEFEFTSGPLTNNRDPSKGKIHHSYLNLHRLYASGRVWFDDVRLEEIIDNPKK